MNGWLLTTLADMSSTVLCLMAGSNSLMELAMHSGRSCIAFEINRKSHTFLLLLVARQFSNGRTRMQDTWQSLQQQPKLRHYWVNKEPALYSPYAVLREVCLNLFHHSF